MASASPLLEFAVPGVPRSHQTHDRSELERWRQRVRRAAAAKWQSAPLTGSLLIRVTYYHEGPSVRLDNDNLLKPIQDALTGLVYEDDRQITHTHVVKTPIDGWFRLRGRSLVVLAAFYMGVPFVHVVVDHAPEEV